jgi:hypothetical protein
VKKGRGSVVALVLVVSAALLAIAGGPGASSAAAQTYCAPGPCTGGIEEPTIEMAVELADAAAGPDTVAIAPGLHTVSEPSCGGLYVAKEDTTLRGAGVGVTILTTPEPDAAESGPSIICGNMHVSDLTLRLPSDSTPALNSSVYGIDLYTGSAERIRIDAPGASFGPGPNDGQAIAGMLRKGVAHEVEVDLDPSQDTDGLRLLQMEEVSDIRSTARYGALLLTIETDPGQAPTVVRRAVLRSMVPLTVSNYNSTDSKVEVSDAILDASATPAEFPAHGVNVFNGNPPEGIELTLDRATIIGNGSEDPESTALEVDGQGGPPTTLHASHLAVTGFARSLILGRYHGDSLTTISYSDLDLGPGAIGEGGPSGTATTSFGPGNRSGNPLLADPAAGNFTPRPGSPAIDIGGPDLLPGSGADLFGNPRPVDGDGDGLAALDAGAVEAPAMPRRAPAPAPSAGGGGGGGGSAAHKVAVTLLGKKILLTPGGVAKWKLRCPASEAAPPCRGSVTLGTIGKVKFRSKRRRVPLAAGRFSLGAGQAGWVAMKLSPAKAELVRSYTAARNVLALVHVRDAAGEEAKQGTVLTIVPLVRHHRKAK